jgi:AbrB family looped-hinge helix DNA binding protein
MVDYMEETTTIDKQGRLVVPSHLREALGVKEGGEISIRLDGPRLILEPVSRDVRRKAKEWADLARNTKTEAFTEEPRESWKWMSREYARRKLGLS